MGNKVKVSNKLSKKSKLLLSILLGSIFVVMVFLAALLYINYYTRVSIVLTTISRFKDGEIKDVREFEIVRLKKGRTVSYFNSPYVEGYNFNGWFLDDECTQPFNYDEPLNKHIQVYGKLDLIEYSIELYLDEELKVESNISQNFNYMTKFTIEDIIRLPFAEDTVKLEDGTEVCIKDYKNLQKAGYTFEGWGLSRSSYATVNTNYSMTANNLSFYAIWKPIEVELKYCTMDLSFAETNVQNNAVNSRLDALTGGIKYNDYSIYVSETLRYADKMSEIVPPLDDYKNFEFAGWYMDPKFTVPVKFGQLYIRNGYFSLTKERDIDILEDPLYYSHGEMITEEQKGEICKYSNRDENNSYILIFAKWMPKQYTIQFNLNLPAPDTYVDTTHMGAILNGLVPERVYSDPSSNTLKIKTNIYQGYNLRSTDFQVGALYNSKYFEDVVYDENDLTGLPLYTLYGWNSSSNGSGYDAQNTKDKYFDKSNFEIKGNVITIYAQWISYYRVNYYFLSGIGNQALLDTVNIKNDKITLPNFYDLVVSVDANTRKIEFTEKQKNQIKADNNNIERDYFTPNNYTFLGWTTRTGYEFERAPLYIPNYAYNIGREVDSDNGIYLNRAIVDLYTTWVSNTNYYTYDLNEDVNVVFPQDLSEEDPSKVQIRRNIIDEDKNYIYYKYDSAGISKTLTTVNSAGKFLISIIKNERINCLTGWRLKDGTFISGQTSRDIEFNATNNLFIRNSEEYEDQYREVATCVYIDGDIRLDNYYYFTKYNEDEDRSYIYYKSRSIKKVVFTANWVETSMLYFDAGASDALWIDGSASDLTMDDVGGSIDVEMPRVDGKLARPYYTFVGWSEVNREAQAIPYHEFVENYTIFQQGEKYSIYDYEIFQEDTTLYAVWKPIQYSLNIYQKKVNSYPNSTTTSIYIAKESYYNGSNFVTDYIKLAGNTIVVINEEGVEETLPLTTSAVVGYGLAGWTNSEAIELIKNGSYYEITIDGINELFNPSPIAGLDYFANIYPLYEILKFDITFKIDGEGINASTPVVYEDQSYGTIIKTLLPSIDSLTTYQEGYVYKGWNISGDIASDGSLKEDYVIDLYNNNLGLKNDLTVSLVAEKIKCTVKFIYTTPDGKTSKTVLKELHYGDNLGVLFEDAQNELNKNYNHFGYNFLKWEINKSGDLTYATAFDGITVTTPLDITTKFEPADVNVNYIYDGIDNPDQIDYFEIVKYASSLVINTSELPNIPTKTGYILKGWSNINGGDNYFVDYDTFVINNKNTTLEESIVDGQKVYDLMLYAKWVESKTITFDTTSITIAGEEIQTSYTFEKGERVYLKNLDISKVAYANITQNNGKGIYNGVWIDQNGVEYSVKSANAYIVLNDNFVLTPKFDAKVYTVNYWYYYGGQYYNLIEAIMSISEDYIEIPTLHGPDNVNTLLDKAIDGYQAIKYYLGVTAFEEKNDSLSIILGGEFDFINNPVYLSLASNNSFDVYIEIRQEGRIFYYSDRYSDSILTSVVVLYGNDYVISNGISEPTKLGYDFNGWNTSLTKDFVEYENGDSIVYSGQLTSLYPVWTPKNINVVYHYIRYDSGAYIPVEEIVATDYEQTIALKSITIDNYRVVGWATTGSATSKEYDMGQNVSVSTMYSSGSTIHLYAVKKNVYTISFNNGVSGTLSDKVQTMVEGETLTLMGFEETELTAKPGSEFKGWTLDGSVYFTTLSFTRSGNTINYGSGTFAMDGDGDYDLTLRAGWDTASYYISFTSKNSYGASQLKHGQIDGATTQIVDTDNVDNRDKYEYDPTTEYIFTFPATASEYVYNGTRYIFANKWRNGATEYTQSTVKIILDQNYDFQPVYNQVYTYSFVDGLVTVSEFNVIQGEEFDFTNSELISAMEAHSLTLGTNKKIVGYKKGGAYYSSYALNADLLTQTETFATKLTANSDNTFDIVIVDIVDIVIYKTFNYTGGFGGEQTINNFVVGDTINFNDYAITGNYSCEGFVLGDDAYVYNPNVANAQIKSNNTVITSAMANGKTTLYFYPVLKAKVEMFINGFSPMNLVDTQYVRLGKTFTINYSNTNEDSYLTNWSTGSTEYSDDYIVVAPVQFIAYERTYFQLQVDISRDQNISNTTELIIGTLKPDDKCNLPDVDEVTLIEAVQGKYTLVGWNISYNGTFITNGGSRVIYAPDSEVTVRGLLTILGVNADSSSLMSYALNMLPVWNYKLNDLTIIGAENITYSFDVRQRGVVVSEELKNKFVINNSGNYLFKIYNGSAVTINSTADTIAFDAYLVDGENLVRDNNSQPIVANVVISKSANTGFTISKGWYYANDLTRKIATFNINNNVEIAVQTAIADNVTLTVKLVYFDGTENIDYSDVNFNEYKAYGYLLNTNTNSEEYVQVFDSYYNNVISFSVVLGLGYEIKSPSGYAISDNTYTYTQLLTGNETIEVVIQKCSRFNPVVTLDTSKIVGYDANKINSGAVELQYYDETWKSFGSIAFSSITSAYTFDTSINSGDLLRVNTSVSSLYYYVENINISIDGAISEFNTNAMTLDSVSVTGAPVITIVLATRTYNVSYEGEEISSGTIGNSLDILMPNTLPTQEGYSLRGMKVYYGSETSSNFVCFITEDTTLGVNASVVKLSQGINSSTQKAEYILVPVWLEEYVGLTFTTDNTKGYFLVNGENAGNEVVFNNILYNEALIFNATIQEGVVSENSFSFKITTGVVIDSDGDIVKNQQDTTVVFVSNGSFKFVGQYSDGENVFENCAINGDLALTPIIEAGVGKISVSIIDSVEGEYNNTNLIYGVISYLNGEDASSENITSDAKSFNFEFETMDDCTIELEENNGFSSTFDIIYGTYKLSNYDDLDDFNSATGLNVACEGGVITFAGLLDEVSIEYTLSRSTYSATIVEASSATAEQNAIYSQLKDKGESIVKVGGNEAVETLILGSREFRNIQVYTVSVNADYFEIDKIYYIDNGTIYYVYGGISDCLSRFNPSTNVLHVVYGGVEGNDLQFYIELKLKAFDVKFHKIDNELFNLDGYSDIAYNNSMAITSSIYTPEDFVKNGVTYTFKNWTYYDGNYENDVANNEMDEDNFKVLTSINWEFNGEKGALHLFANWYKLFNVSYFTDVTDGIYVGVIGTFTSVNNKSQLDNIELTVPTRVGFDFKGYEYDYNGTTYHINYNGESFNELKVGDTTIKTISSSTIIGDILPDGALNINDTFKDIVLTPVWEQSIISLTSTFDSSKGSLQQYKFNETKYTLSSFDVRYYYTLEMGEITISTITNLIVPIPVDVTYSAIIVKDGDSKVGAYAIISNTDNYYDYDKTILNGTQLTNSAVQLLGDSELEITFKEMEVPHTLSLIWSEDFDGIVNYRIENDAEGDVVVEAYDNGILEHTYELKANEYVDFTRQYYFVFKALRGVSINCYIEFEEYNIGENNSAIRYKVDDNTASSNQMYFIHCDTIDLNFEQYFGDNLVDVDTTAGEYSIGYYEAEFEPTGNVGGYGSAPTVVTSVGGEISLTQLVVGTKIYFTPSNFKYDIVALMCGDENVMQKDGDQIYIDLSNDDLINNSTIKVVCEIKATEVNFSIGGITYASGYIEGTADIDPTESNVLQPSPTSELVAFTQLITYGYDVLFNDVGNSAYLTDLFGSETANLTGQPSSTVKSKIIKSNGSVREYYTEGDFINMFKFALNKNIANNSSEYPSLTNIWFEGWDLSSAYNGIDFEDGIVIDENNMFITKGLESITFVADISVALIFQVNAMIEENSLGNGANASGVIWYKGSSAEGYSFELLDESIESEEYSGGYIKLCLKVKNGTSLPEFDMGYDKHTYVSGNLASYDNKVLTTEEGIENSLVVDADGRYCVDINFYVKQVKIIAYLESEEGGALGEERYDSEFAVNYNTTFKEIIDYYGIQEIIFRPSTYSVVVVPVTYLPKEAHMSNGASFDLNTKLYAYLNNNEVIYNNGSVVGVTIVYQAQ